jgi:hypothetical protein
VWSALGLFRVSGAKTGMMISAGAMLLANWAAQWVGLGLYGPPDPSSVATALVGVVDNASIPVFLIISLFCEPVRGYFSGHRLGS